MALALLAPTGAMAQAVRRAVPPMRPPTHQQAAPHRAQDRPDATRPRLLTPRASANATPAAKPMATPGAPLAATVPLGRQLWGNVLQSASWAADSPAYGIYTLAAAPVIDPTARYTSPYLFANAGGALSKRRLDVIVYNVSYGTMSHYAFDPATGSFQNGSYLNDYSLWSTETAVAKDGTVYGDFYSADATRFELGVADYAADTRTTIGQLYHYYVALGITSADVLYGVATDGNLYSIDPATAKETLVGPTGVRLTLDDGTWNVQSGEIDPATDIFYWACTDYTGHSALYTVDLATGAATKVGDMAGGEQVALLHIPEDNTPPEAPAMAGELSADFDKAALSGTIRFTIPRQAYMGGALEGTVGYAVEQDGKAVANGTAEPGGQVSVPVTAERGNHQFAVTLSNDAGNGPTARLMRFVGDDTPLAPSSVKAELEVKTGAVQLSWEPVTGGENGGYVADITYDVTRLPDQKAVANATTATQLTDQLPEGELRGWSYAVTAVSGKQRSQAAQSNAVTYGDVPEPPFSEGFDTESSLSTFTIDDANGDGVTWHYCASDAEGQGAVQIDYANDDHDDWLFTPPLRLKAGNLYNISYRVATKGPSYPEVLEVGYGAAATPEAMDGTLAERTELTNKDYATVRHELTPKEDGVYYFGFHATSDANYCWQLSLDDIAVAGNSQKAPAAPTAVTAQADPEGRLSCTVGFTTPAEAIDGSPLTGTLSATIRRGGEAIASMQGLEPGKHYEYTDNAAKNGENAYTVSTANAAGEGRQSETASDYVGMDVPGEVKGIKASLTAADITLSWDTVTTGDHGGYVDPEDMTYNVYAIEETATGVNLTTVAQTRQTTATIDYATDEGEQQMINYALSATNALDEGPRVMSPGIIVGQPYALPFEEHFTGGALDHPMWWISRDGQSEFALMQGLSADGDGGCAGYISVSDTDQATLGSGKIALDGAANATLLFATRATMDGCGGQTTVYLHRPDDTTEQLYQTGYGTEKDQWQTHSVALPSDCAALPYIRLTFVTAATAGATVYFDDIHLSDAVDHDLRTAISAPARARKGDTVSATIALYNRGTKPAEGYTVTLYADGKPVATQQPAEAIAPYGHRAFTMGYKTSVMGGQEVTLRAVAELDNDAHPDDNAAETTVRLTTPDKPAPTDVEAEYTAEGTRITWKAPVVTAESVSEDFESYAPWSMDDFGDWTSVYGEKGLAKGPFSRSYPHPNEGKRFAYTVVRPDSWLNPTTIDDYACLQPHGGSQYLATFYSVENSQFVPADNWLISPSLPGEAQTITFWANNFSAGAISYAEQCDVLCSTSGTATADFQRVAAQVTAEGGTWRQYTAQLPEGTTYFALHNNTADTYMFMLDDISFRAGSGSVTGYNVYCDGQLLATLPADATSYTQLNPPVGGTNTYGVSAIYAGGESEAATVKIGTGIGAATLRQDDTAEVRTLDGRLAGHGTGILRRLPKGVYVVDGRKVTVK